MRKINVCQIVFFVAMALFGATGAASAATLYVDSAFNDPLGADQYRTISAAVAAAQSGDTVQVAGGDYPDAVNITKGLTLQGSGPQHTRVNSTITVNTVEAVKIAGFTISSSGNGITVAQRTASVDIMNNCIVGNGGYGIFASLSSTTTTIQWTLNITNNTITGNGTMGIYTYTTSSPPTVNITNNIISNNGSYGIDIYQYNSFAISRNDIYGNNGSGDSGCSSTQKDYCRVILVAGTNLSVDPLFVDANQGNFTPQLTSPCRNNGTLSPSTLNPDGTRNDIGAYGGPGAASFWPYGNGPIVTGVSATPMRIDQGGTITINATAKVR